MNREVIISSLCRKGEDFKNHRYHSYGTSFGIACGSHKLRLFLVGEKDREKWSWSVEHTCLLSIADINL